MGCCVQKPNKIIHKSDSLRRKMSSIIMTAEEAQKLNSEPASHARSKLPSHGKPLQGSLVILDEKVVLAGLTSPNRQCGFEDKRMSINTIGFTTDHLSSIGISVTCKKGLKSDIPNQDDYFVSIEKTCIILGVFDGHGVFGHDISNFVHSTLPSILMSHPEAQTNPISALRSSFYECQHQLIALNESLDCSASGSTATILYIVNGKLYIAHVGDSRAVIAEEISSNLLVKNLTRDHRPNLPDEEERIKNSGGEIRQLNDDAPYRIFKPGENYPGINMSRAFGDTLSGQFGVICEPEICEIELKDSHRFILICSDGVWEFVNSQEAVNFVKKYLGDAKKATDNLAALAWMRWKSKYDCLVDDITAILIQLNNDFIKEHFLRNTNG